MIKEYNEGRIDDAIQLLIHGGKVCLGVRLTKLENL